MATGTGNIIDDVLAGNRKGEGKNVITHIAEGFASGIVRTTQGPHCQVEPKLGIMHGRLPA